MSNVISVIFLSAIAFFFVKSIVQKNVNYKNECVSLGILGTFVGISVGLFYFNTQSISQSIPFFLDGLKTAFITSGAGITASIILSLLNPKEQDTQHLESLIALQSENNIIVANVLNDIKDSTATEIVANLRKIVDEFNQNVEQQFGDNFRELNGAVKEMVEWQKNYKDHIETHQQTLADNHSQYLNRVKVVETIENKKIEKMDRQFSVFLNKFNGLYETLLEKEKNIKTLVDSFEADSIKVSASLSNNVAKVNKQIADSASLAEENLTLLIGVANGKLKYA